MGTSRTFVSANGRRRAARSARPLSHSKSYHRHELTRTATSVSSRSGPASTASPPWASCSASSETASSASWCVRKERRSSAPDPRPGPAPLTWRTCARTCGLSRGPPRACGQNPRASLLVPDAAKAIVDCLQEYVRTSAWPVFDRVHQTGHWRLALVRTTESGQGTVHLSPRVALPNVAVPLIVSWRGSRAQG